MMRISELETAEEMIDAIDDRKYESDAADRLSQDLAVVLRKILEELKSECIKKSNEKP